KEKIELLEKYQAKSLVTSPSVSSLDVFSIVMDGKSAYVNYLKIKNGAIHLTKTVELTKRLEESDTEMLVTAIVRLREQFQSDAKEIITNIAPEEPIEGLQIHVPKIGDKSKLVALSLKNALYFRKEKAMAAGVAVDKKNRVLAQLQQDLSLKDLPNNIECFDNSNIQGTHPVASMVSFKDGKPNSKEYRHYHVKTVEGPNDFASMEEIVERRYRRLLEENKPMPNLILIDGGKGQLSSATQALKKLGLYGQIPIIGIAKRLEEIYFPEDPYPLHIDKTSESFRLLQRVRDEAHRFAINFHRQVRSKKAFNTQLTEIQGIGAQTADKLLKHFKSYKKIREADHHELVALIGKDKAEKLSKAIKEKAG